MQILLVGTGNMARGISTRLVAGGHEVAFYNPDPGDAEKLAADVRGTGRTRVARDLDEGIRASDIIILASWYAVNLQTARERSAALEGRILVDISNPLTETFDGLVTEGGPSGAEHIRDAVPTSTRVVKAFNTTFAGTLLEGSVAGQPLDVFIAGDDEGARRTVGDLVTSGGMNPIEVGPLERSRQLEAMGFLGISLQDRLGTGFMSGWKLVMPRKSAA